MIPGWESTSSCASSKATSSTPISSWYSNTCARVNKNTSPNKLSGHIHALQWKCSSAYLHTHNPPAWENKNPHKQHIHTHTRQESLSSSSVYAGRRTSVTEQPPNRCLIVFGLWFNCWMVFQHSEGIENTPGLQLQQMPALKKGGFWNHCLGGNCLHRKPQPNSALILLWSQKINLCHLKKFCFFRAFCKFI